MKRLYFAVLLGVFLAFGSKGAVIYPDTGGGGTNGSLIPLITITTNYYLFSTNLFVSNSTNNTYVSNYFNTNVNNNLYVSNFFRAGQINLITNQYLTNLTVTNFYGGDTYVSNFFNTNVFTVNQTVSNFFATNLYTDIQVITTNFYGYTTNLFVENVTNNYLITTNLFIDNRTTNFLLFSTNIVNNNSYVSNYFTTNVFQNSYMSNFFLTNQVFYQTNLYLSYIVTTNYLTYISNQFVSNFFTTNIFATDNFVSNYFVTNFNSLVEVTSNYVYNIAWPLTNATLWGTTTFSPTNGTSGGSISMYSNNVEMITLNASGGYISGNTVFFRTNSWAGPTNTLPMNVEDQFYLTSVPGLSAAVILTISNASGSNVSWRLPSTVAIPERTSLVTISNGSQGVLSIRYHPSAGTNAVYRQF